MFGPLTRSPRRTYYISWYISDWRICPNASFRGEVWPKWCWKQGICQFCVINYDDCMHFAHLARWKSVKPSCISLGMAEEKDTLNNCYTFMSVLYIVLGIVYLLCQYNTNSFLFGPLSSTKTYSKMLLAWIFIRLKCCWEKNKSNTDSKNVTKSAQSYCTFGQTMLKLEHR